MKKLIAILSTALFIYSSAAAFAAPPAIGQPAPAFTGTDSSGKTVNLSDFKGKIVVLEWTSSECPFVKKHYDSGNMQKLQKQAAADGVVWLSIDSSAPQNPGYMDGPAATAWIKDHNAAPADLLIDGSGDIGHLYQAKTTPHMFVIDKNGNLAYAGAIDSIPSVNPDDAAKAANYVQAAVDALKTGKPVAITEVQSYGCSIKYGS